MPEMKKLLWVDLEMTGLDENIHHILEVAAAVTDLELNVLETLSEVVYQPADVLSLMDDWCVKTHGKSGLTAAVPNGKPPAQVEKLLLELIERHFKKKDDRIVLAGNSISNDRRFIDKYWKGFAARLHYRMVDVSSFKEIFRERFGITFKKQNQHRAVDDIHESISELKTYLSYVKIPEKGGSNG